MRTYSKVLKIYVWKKAGATATGNHDLILDFNGNTYKATIDFGSLPTYDETATDATTDVVFEIAITRAFNVPVMDWPNEPTMKGIKFMTPHYSYEEWIDDLVLKTEVIEASGLEPMTNVPDMV